MLHTTESLLSLADSYADAECSDYLTGEASSLWYRENLLKALTEALAQPVQVPLTEEQIEEIYAVHVPIVTFEGFHNYAIAIERAHHIGGDK